jgi:hypothetical protein
VLAGCASTPDGKKPLFVPVATNELGQVTYEVNPGINNAIRTGQQIGQQILPAPWGTVVGTVLTLTTAGLTWFAKRKSAEAAVVPALIAGIEASPNNADVKTTIQRIATATGVEKKLNKLVNHNATVMAKKDFGK